MQSVRLSFQPVTPTIIRVFDESDDVIERREHTGDFKEPRAPLWLVHAGLTVNARQQRPRSISGPP